MKFRLLIAATCAASLLVAGCGSSTSSVSTTPTSAVSTTTGSSSDVSASTVPASTAPSSTAPSSTGASGSTTTPGAPLRIVSLAPALTEMIFAIGAGDQVIAVDDQSNYPAEALQLPHDLSGFKPNVEAIAALKPDLVLISGDSSGLSKQMENLKIKVWVGAAAVTFDDVYAEIEQLGAITGHVGDAAELVSKMQTEIKAAVAAAPAASTGLTYYHELDPTYYSVTSKTFIGSVYALFGLKNIADQSPAGNDYPQLSAEFIIQQNPSLIFLADTKCCQQTPQSVAARPGWNAIGAVKDGTGVFAMDDDLASRWGPRVVDYVKAVSAALNKVPARVG